MSLAHLPNMASHMMRADIRVSTLISVLVVCDCVCEYEML